MEFKKNFPKLAAVSSVVMAFIAVVPERVLSVMRKLNQKRKVYMEDLHVLAKAWVSRPVDANLNKECYLADSRGAINLTDLVAFAPRCCMDTCAEKGEK
jgi:hypothetical protein